jgi:hypothetical protein
MTASFRMNLKNKLLHGRYEQLIMVLSSNRILKCRNQMSIRQIHVLQNELLIFINNETPP